MMFEINQQLQKDTHYLLKKGSFHLLLHKNASIPWFIIVPETDVTEVFDLPEPMQCQLGQLIKAIATYLKAHYNSENINTAAIGNVVSQLHVHIIGRRSDDECWPEVLWGNEYSFVKWKNKIITEIIQDFNLIL